VYEIAGMLKLWSVVRLVSGMKEKEADSLAPALTEVLVRGREIALGPYGGMEFVISEPIAPKEITVCTIFCPE
jgi:phosphorylase kinase alpha/beta subunit